MRKEKLFTRSYCLILAANFLLYFGFWLLVPILPFYLKEIFHTQEAAIGLILCSYTISALCIRPFSGFLLDMFSRKPLYIAAYLLFTSIFVGYMLAGTLTLFILLRTIHGLAFGGVTVAGNTLVVDIMPSARRGEGLGYYGLTNNMAMSIGPMTGLLLHDWMTFEEIFASGLITCFIGRGMAYNVKTPVKPQIRSEEHNV